MREQCLELGTEDNIAVCKHRVIQRLDPQAIARQEKRLLRAIPEREREHAAKPRDAAFAPCLPRMHDDLGIASGSKVMAECDEFRDQLLVVVDLAVEDDAD